MPFFSIIIVSWNALEHLKTYLPSVVATEYPQFEIILADNASNDGSKKWVREHYPNIKIAEFDRNYGYCGGNNRAVSYAEGDILIFLNNDVRVEPDWLQNITPCFQKDENIAAVQPKMLSDKNPEQFEYAGAAGGFLDRFGYPFCRGRVFDRIEKDHGQYDDETDIFWASGAALAIKKKIFQEFGPFDEDFEFHMEEIDLCWRLWNAGYNVRYCPQSTVYHFGGGSLPMDSPRKIYYNYRNNLRMLWKNCSSKTLPFRFSMRYILDIIAAFRSLSTGEKKEFKAIATAHWDFWENFHYTQEKRSSLQKRRKVEEDPHTLLPVSIVKEYFLAKKRKFSQLV